MAAPTTAATVAVNSDITANLPSLQFENALSEHEKELLCLRVRSHAITVSAIAQATYLVSVFNEARKFIKQCSDPVQKASSRLLQTQQVKNPIQVGILGCGRLGRQLAQSLLTYAGVLPSELKISTRRPETLNEFSQKGVDVKYDNEWLVASTGIVFLCFLPSNLPAIAEGIAGKISEHCVLYSFISGIPTNRIRQLLRHETIVRPEISWNPDKAEDNSWDVNIDTIRALENEEVAGSTCPIALHKEDYVVSTSERWMTIAIYLIMNECGRHHLPKDETLDIVNRSFIGKHAGLPDTLKESTLHISRRQLSIEDKGSSGYKHVNIAEICEDDNLNVTKTFLENMTMRQNMIKRYLTIFDKFSHWKGMRPAKK